MTDNLAVNRPLRARTLMRHSRSRVCAVIISSRGQCYRTPRYVIGIERRVRASASMCVEWLVNSWTVALHNNSSVHQTGVLFSNQIASTICRLSTGLLLLLLPRGFLAGVVLDTFPSLLWLHLDCRRIDRPPTFSANRRDALPFSSSFFRRPLEPPRRWFRLTGRPTIELEREKRKSTKFQRGSRIPLNLVTQLRN